MSPHATGSGLTQAPRGTAAAPSPGLAAGAGGWPYGPHAAAMLSFNLLPSRWLHASRWPALLPPGWPVPAADDEHAHRHCSALLLRQLGRSAAPVTDWQRPEWPLAVLPPPVWDRLLQRLGLVLLQPLLRQLIDGTTLRALATAVGADELRWARQGAPRLPSALQPPPAVVSLAIASDEPDLPARLPQRLSQWVPQLPLWAAGLLAQATAAAPVPMRQRLALRAPAAPATAPDLAATRAAWALTLTLLDELEPAWRSSFPGSR